MAAKWALEASWGPLGALKKAWSAKGGLPGAHIWDALGRLLGRSRAREKILLNGSWPLQEEFQDRFQPSWGPKGSRKGGQEGPKRDFFKKYCSLNRIQ